MITDLFITKSIVNEKSTPITVPDISLIADEFDIMNNDVVTLKPSHELNAKQRNKDKVISDQSILDLEITNESIDENNNLINYIDFKFDNLVSLIILYFAEYLNNLIFIKIS